MGKGVSVRKKVVIVLKGALEGLPPIISVAISARRLECDVVVIVSTCNPTLRSQLELSGITVIETMTGVSAPSRIINKVSYWRRFRSEVNEVLRKYRTHLLWVGSADTALALLPTNIPRDSVLHLHELYDHIPGYSLAVRYWMRRCGVSVVPDICRAALCRLWYGLETTPYVLPNRPVEHPRRRKMPLSDPHVADLLTLCEGKRVVLYQGHIDAGRDICPIARAVQEMGTPWVFVAMGQVWENTKESKRVADRLRLEAPSTVYIPHICPPLHLEVTSHAHVGVVTYTWDRLNHLFCAPNKIWEYAGFGIPMLCNDVPSLQYGIAGPGAGVCLDLRSVSFAKEGLVTLDSHYSEFSERAAKFFEGVDVVRIVGTVLRDKRLNVT
jgi:hypothetical protein